jgi:hypothetical protein
VKIAPRVRNSTATAAFREGRIIPRRQFMQTAVDVQPLPVRQLLPALLLGALFVLTIYLVQYDQGALSQSGTLLHELMHDGRHLLGVPCH